MTLFGVFKWRAITIDFVRTLGFVLTTTMSVISRRLSLSIYKYWAEFVYKLSFGVILTLRITIAGELLVIVVLNREVRRGGGPKYLCRIVRRV